MKSEVKVALGTLIAIAVVFLVALYLPSPVAGTPDTTFHSPDGFVRYNSGADNKDRGVEVAVQPDGKIVVLGYSNTSASEDLFLARYTAGGRPDTSFGNSGFVLWDGGGNDRGMGLALQPDGKILATGFTYNGSKRDVLLLRYTPEGKPDSTFGSGGVVTYNSPASGTDIGFGIALQPDGGILVAGETANRTNQEALVLRYTSAGAPDPRFGTNGVVTCGKSGTDRAFAVAVQPDSRIVVAGSTVIAEHDDVLLFRLNADGTPDPAFGQGGIVTWSGEEDHADYGNCMTVEPDGKILVSGTVSEGGGFDVLLLKFNADGTPDIGFGWLGMVRYGDASTRDEYSYAHAVQPDGKIVLTGYKYNGENSDDVLLLRYDDSGEPDTHFGYKGITTWNGPGNNMDYGQGIALQPDGKIVVTGFSHNGRNEDLLLMRVMG